MQLMRNQTYEIQNIHSWVEKKEHKFFISFSEKWERNINTANQSTVSWQCVKTNQPLHPMNKSIHHYHHQNQNNAVSPNNEKNENI